MKRFQTTLILAAIICLSVIASQPICASPSYPYETWMADMADKIGNDTLESVILPGTHDSGTYDLEDKYACEACVEEGVHEFEKQRAEIDASVYGFFFDDLTEHLRNIPIFGYPAVKLINRDIDKIRGIIRKEINKVNRDWAQAQDESIAEQLRNGIRYFDLRFFSDTDGKFYKFYIHHTLKGPSSDVILNDIQNFVNAPGHEKEIVILKFSNMQAKEGERGMSDESHRVFIGRLYKRFGDLMIRKPPEGVNDSPKLKDIWANGKRVLILYEYINDDPDGKFPDKNLLPEADRALFWNCRPKVKPGQITYLVDQECGTVKSLGDLPMSEWKNIGQQVEDLVNCDKGDIFFWSLGVSISANDKIIKNACIKKVINESLPTITIPVLRRDRKIISIWGRELWTKKLKLEKFDLAKEAFNILVEKKVRGFEDFPRHGFIPQNLRALASYVNGTASPSLHSVDPDRLNIITMDYHEQGGLVPLVIELNNKKNTPPVANINGRYHYGNEGSTTTFNASGSRDYDGDKLQYRWDYDDDGTWGEWSSKSTYDRTWPDDYEGEVTVAVEVTDGNANDTATTTVTVKKPSQIARLTRKAIPILSTGILLYYIYRAKQ